jgi:hypothetical protein
MSRHTRDPQHCLYSYFHSLSQRREKNVQPPACLAYLALFALHSSTLLGHEWYFLANE